jgi:N-acetylglutamate synthase-like GNAT family acetyltransferase
MRNAAGLRHRQGGISGSYRVDKRRARHSAARSIHARLRPDVIHSTGPRGNILQDIADNLAGLVGLNRIAVAKLHQCNKGLARTIGASGHFGSKGGRLSGGHPNRQKGSRSRPSEPVHRLNMETMRLNVFLEPNPTRKRELLERLTAGLPQWFGLPASNAKYAMLAETLDGYIAEWDGARRGLLLLKYHSQTSAEIYWIGVDPACHRKGVGRTLMKAAIEDACRQGVQYLFVATLHPDVDYEPFLRTRRFYKAMGFVYVHAEHFPADPVNPIAYYLKQL